MENSNVKNMIDKNHHHKIKSPLKHTVSDLHEEVSEPYVEGEESFKMALDLFEKTCDNVFEIASHFK
jgi:hypothetical protein